VRGIRIVADTLKLQALANWLSARAPPQTDFVGTVAELGRRMNAAELSVGLLGVYMLNINPLVLGTLVSWTPRGGAKVVCVSHEDMAGPVWCGTIAHASQTTRRVIRHRIGSGDELDMHPSTVNLKNRGYIEYLCCPLLAMHGPASVFTVATKQADGFTEDEATAIRRLQAPLARVVEAQILYDNTVSVLSTYVGRNAGEKVLHGRILRGDSENIAQSSCSLTSKTSPPSPTLARLRRSSPS
jgi:adenylate cyclase